MNDLLDAAWAVIANVSGGVWDAQSAEWRETAERWRDKYFAQLAVPPVMPKAETPKTE